MHHNIPTTNNGFKSTLQASTTSRLIPLNKNQGLCQIDVGEVLRQMAGKILMQIARKDVQQSMGALLVCTGQDAVIHAMHDLYQQDEVDAVLLVDEENASAMLHYIFITCPVISTFSSNCYLVRARPFVIGNKE